MGLKRSRQALQFPGASSARRAAPLVAFGAWVLPDGRTSFRGCTGALVLSYKAHIGPAARCGARRNLARGYVHQGVTSGVRGERRCFQGRHDVDWGPSLPDPDPSEAPRIAWSYWDRGYDHLPEFRRLCVETWRAKNPGWKVRLLDQRSVFDFLLPEDLPRLWPEMYVPWQADAVRLALLVKYGGLWIDASTICFQPFDEWMFNTIASDDSPQDIGAFYFSAWGVEMHRSSEYVENWVMASRRRHPLMLAWWALFNGYWNSKIRADSMSIFLDPPGVPDHPLFHDVDLSHLNRFGQDLRNYLLMHAAFKKLIDHYPEMRYIWQKEMLLLRADDTAFWHMEEEDVQWNVKAALRKWLGPIDRHWLKRVRSGCPVLKFTRDTAVELDKLSREQCLEGSSCLGAAFRAALEPGLPA